jgi:orotate phosphoribosyltransferase
MEKYQQDFIELAIKYEVLCFGEFTLKSGRISPFFFNAGRFNSGKALAAVGRCYADAIVHQSAAQNLPEFDIIFGPAYKGIPLVSSIVVALAEHHQRDIPYCFNRKEQKAHGEGGQLVGAVMKDKRVLIVDDVITAGTAIREVMALLENNGAKAAGVVIGLDRQEKGAGERMVSAVQEVREQYRVPVLSVITLKEIVDYLRQGRGNETLVERIRMYQQQYGILGDVK